VIARLDEDRERSRAECRPYAGVESKIVQRFRSTGIGLRVIETGTGEDIRFGVCAGESEYEICQCAHYSEVGARRIPRRNSTLAFRHGVVHRIEPNAEGQFCDADGETDEPVIPGFLDVAEFRNRYRGPTSQSERVGFLTGSSAGNRCGQEHWHEQSTTKSIHPLGRLGTGKGITLAGNITPP